MRDKHRHYVKLIMDNGLVTMEEISEWLRFVRNDDAFKHLDDGEKKMMPTKEQIDKLMTDYNNMNIKNINDKMEQNKKIAKLENQVAYLIKFAPIKKV